MVLHSTTTPTKISSIITSFAVNIAVYNSKFKNILTLSSLPLGVTSILYHVFEIKKIRYLDMCLSGIACFHFSYYSYYTNNIKSLIMFLNTIPIYSIVKILEKYKQHTYSCYMHSILHYWLILSTAVLLKKNKLIYKSNIFITR